MENKVTTDLIFGYIKKLVEEKKPIDKKDWLDIAFKLNILRIDEAERYNQMRQDVARTKLAVLRSQEKRNVAAAELEVEASDEYRIMKNQESKVDTIDEFIRISKKNADVEF